MRRQHSYRPDHAHLSQRNRRRLRTPCTGLSQRQTLCSVITTLETSVLPTTGTRRVDTLKPADLANPCLELISKMFSLSEMWELRPDATNPLWAPDLLIVKARTGRLRPVRRRRGRSSHVYHSGLLHSAKLQAAEHGLDPIARRPTSSTSMSTGRSGSRGNEPETSQKNKGAANQLVICRQ